MGWRDTVRDTLIGDAPPTQPDKIGDLDGTDLHGAALPLLAGAIVVVAILAAIVVGCVGR